MRLQAFASMAILLLGWHPLANQRPVANASVPLSTPQVIELIIPLVSLKGPGQCVDCWNDPCPQWFHWAARGPGLNWWQGPHSECLANYPNDPFGCDGHLSCADDLSSGSELDRANALATQAIRGDPESLSEFISRYPSRARLNTSWNVWELVACPKSGAIFGVVSDELLPETSRESLR